MEISIKTAGDVQLSLASTESDEKNVELEILFGIHNSFSYIKDNAKIVFGAESRELLKVDDWKKFTIGWSFGSAMIYENNHDEIPMMNHKFDSKNFEVKFIGFKAM